MLLFHIRDKGISERVKIDHEYPRARRGRKPRSPYASPDLTDDLATRSRLTTREGFVVGVDGRSAWARRFRDLIAAHSNDMGGSDQMTEGQRCIIRRISLLQIEAEFSEMKIALAREADEEPGGVRLDRYRQMAETQRRLIESLGLHQARRPRNVTPPDNASGNVRAQNTERILRYLDGELA